MKNVQITIDEETLSLVDQTIEPLGLNRSEVVRQALREWLRRNAVQSFEQEWVKSLKKKPDTASRADDWAHIQSWSKK
jgi:metal-responsive CopG/Arc/MetJ family transcriptional regulator